MKLMKLTRFANVKDPRSLSNRLRSRRFERFERLTEPLPRPLRILDVGGTTDFWEQRGWAGRDGVEIVMLNLTAQERRYDNIEPRAGDATDLGEYEDDSFDVIFSNSTIEHLFTRENQRRMAREVVRVGRAYWVQTPNFWFPMEPHFLVPGWQWLPESARVAILRRRRCGWVAREPDPERARHRIREVRLLTRGELRELFPGADVWGERFLGLVKSWVVTGGFPPESAGAASTADPR